ncbi:hypothetical protein GQ44DRAFT_658938 [Phaeosphaeriaceae sp. PMI808]|nr:hypothetical protein GQ44DRAFT_658938 [Phaeosphaeriaceae sp. PMI808]
MKKITSFKAQYRQAPGRSDPPLRPVSEPLSPVLGPVEYPATSTPAAALPQPVYPYPYQHHHNHDRPAKRARSEYHTSPPYGHHPSRPATSHIPGYNVELMMDTGTRMFQETRPPLPALPSSSQSLQTGGPNGDKMLSDAELLLFFSNVSAHTAQTPPSTAKRWSLSRSQPSLSPNRNMPAAALPAQTRTPPRETAIATQLPPVQEVAPVEDTKDNKDTKNILDTTKPKKQGWPRGKPRGSRTTPSAGKRKKSTSKPKNASSTATSVGPDHQLQSPQSLPAEQPDAMVLDGPSTTPTNVEPSQPPELQQPSATSPNNRRHSFSTQISQSSLLRPPPDDAFRAQSLPLASQTTTTVPNDLHLQHIPRPKNAVAEQPDLICAACKSSDSEVKVGDGEQWIGCDGCKEWYHYACAGFSSEREVREVNKFYCDPCRPKFGETTKVRKSVRAHTTVDYAGLNEGVLKTSDDNPEHHYIAAFKNGDLDFTLESFARMPPELITAEFLEKSNGFKEPILLPGALNTCTAVEQPMDQSELSESSQFEYAVVDDVGQDKLDMVIPEGLTVRRVAELYGANEPVPVIDVKAQEGEGKKWTMGKWADYYEQQGEKPVRNVISLEVSRSRLGRLIRRPKAVRDMDLQDSVWREDDKFAPPPVQFYCLMSVADCFTDFHIDFGGSSVYYHIVKGRKVFFFIPPTKKNLQKYEDWCLSPNQGHDWLGKQVKECYRVDLYPGDTMLIPSGWIHAVWTPEDSLVIGGNFLTRIHYGMQIKVLEIEKNTKVALQFRYPFFQKIMWLTVIKYLEEDPLPEPILRLLQSGEQFERAIPIYCEPDKFGHNSHLGPTYYNRRYYSKHELEGLTDLLNYIWRTVLISLDKIDVLQKTRSAVTRSIPKGHGEPLFLAKRFAMWIAWKRGNETIPTWALLDASLPDVVETSEKKPSAAQVKKKERESLSEALRATAERSSARIRASEPSPPKIEEVIIPNGDISPPNDIDIEPPHLDLFSPLTGFLRPAPNNPHITTPKTSQLGPKRVACDACRKRRIRCKHKDELIDTSKPGMHTIDLSGSYGISVKRRLSDHSLADAAQSGSSTTGGPLNGGAGPIMADGTGDPYALKSGRVKACADCRKSKRRCIHDEYGNVDPVKANEIPIPRGSATKKRRSSDNMQAQQPPSKRLRNTSLSSSSDNTFSTRHRHSFPNPFASTSSSLLLRDLAFEALAQDVDVDVPIDPALEGYGGVVSSIEGFTTHRSEDNDDDGNGDVNAHTPFVANGEHARSVDGEGEGEAPIKLEAELADHRNGAGAGARGVGGIRRRQQQQLLFRV